MQALRQPGMRDRHWQQLSEQLGMTLKPDKDFVLSKALDMHLMDHLDTIQKVPFSMHATKLLHSQLLYAVASHSWFNISLPSMYMLYQESVQRSRPHLSNSSPVLCQQSSAAAQVLTTCFEVTGRTDILSLQVVCWLQVSEVAGKESSIEVALDKMAAEWATAEITVLEYRDTGTFVIKLDEAVLQQLDDHIGARPLQAASQCIWYQMSQSCNFAQHVTVISVPYYGCTLRMVVH